MSLRTRLLVVSLLTLAVGLGALVLVGNLLLRSGVHAQASSILRARAQAQLAELRVTPRGVSLHEGATDDVLDRSSWVFAGGLHDPDASTVLRPKGGEVLVTDGPYAEGTEHLGGFTIIDVADLDAAIEWGRRTALASTLPIEVRPFRQAF